MSRPLTMRLDAVIGHGGVDGVTAAGADTPNTDALGVDIGQRLQIIYRGTYVFDPGGGVFKVVRIAAASPW